MKKMLKPLIILNYSRFRTFIRVMGKQLVLLVGAILFGGMLLAQPGEVVRTWVFFSDKSNDSDIVWLSDATLQRRQRLGISNTTEIDKAVSPGYLMSVRQTGAAIVGVSRWLNGCVIDATEQQLAATRQLPFVQLIEAYGLSPVTAEADSADVFPWFTVADSLLVRYQTNRLERMEFDQKGLNGAGIRIAVFDVGFLHADKHPALQHLFQSGQILGVYDFIDKDTTVFAHGSHGTQVLACLAGMWDTIPMGLATGASYYLLRTERKYVEPKSEEIHWIEALEWADQVGIDIVNSSLGYTETRYFPEQMTGKVAPVSMAASMAAGVGILIVNAVGNEAEERWRTIIAPADADSILSVGGTNPYTDLAASFSSPGPSADGRLKPNVSAPGITLLPAGLDGYGVGYGTSYSSPLVAGFAACLLQHNDSLTPMQLLEAVEQSGHLYPYFDYHHGYGVPLASKALGTKAPVDTTIRVEWSEEYLNLMIAKDLVPDEVDEEGMPRPLRNVYYHFQRPDGFLRKYGVVAAEEEEVLFFSRETLDSGDIFRAHFEGYTIQITIP